MGCNTFSTLGRSHMTYRGPPCPSGGPAADCGQCTAQGGTWRRGSGEFRQRFQPENPNGFEAKKIVDWAGTVGNFTNSNCDAMRIRILGCLMGDFFCGFSCQKGCITLGNSKSSWKIVRFEQRGGFTTIGPHQPTEMESPVSIPIFYLHSIDTQPRKISSNLSCCSCWRLEAKPLLDGLIRIIFQFLWNTLDSPYHSPWSKCFTTTDKNMARSAQQNSPWSAQQKNPHRIQLRSVARGRLRALEICPAGR